MAAKRVVVTIGDKLRSARIKSGKSQYEIAVAAGVRPEVISRLENNRTGVSLASLHKLAPVLGLTIDELVKDQLNVKKPVAKAGTAPAKPTTTKGTKT